MEDFFFFFCCIFFFFFKQKTAYEIYQCDWSSDVCSSDLPGDVWDIPLVNNFHIEKSSHPCQYPVGLVERLILALSNKGDIVVDPFIGSGTTAVASLLHKRKCIGIEKESKYIKTAQERLAKVFSGNYQYKSYLNPILFPNSQLNTKSIIQNDKL